MSGHKILAGLFEANRLVDRMRESIILVTNFSTARRTGNARGYRLKCGRCARRQVVPMGWMGEPIPDGEAAQALAAMQRAGWFVATTAERDRCPDCRRKQRGFH